MNKNYTFIMTEWYDYNLEKGKRQFAWSNYVFTIYEDFSNGKDELWYYSQYADDTDNILACKLYAYSNRSHISSDETSSHHMKSSKDWLSFYGMNGAEYQGIVGSDNSDYNLRGLLATQWKNHVFNVSQRTSSSGEPYLYTQDYDITFYWSLGSNWNYAGSSYTSDVNDSVPLRVSINGTHWSNYSNGSTS